MCQVHYPQAAVCTPQQHQHPSYCRRALRSQEVPPGLGGGSREEHSPVGEDWGCDGAEIELRRKGGEWR